MRAVELDARGAEGRWARRWAQSRPMIISMARVAAKMVRSRVRPAWGGKVGEAGVVVGVAGFGPEMGLSSGLIMPAASGAVTRGR